MQHRTVGADLVPGIQDLGPQQLRVLDTVSKISASSLRFSAILVPRMYNPFFTAATGPNSEQCILGNRHMPFHDSPRRLSEPHRDVVTHEARALRSL
jgi:hypothetical protein